MNPEIAASLRHLKEAAAHLSAAAQVLAGADSAAAANIEQLLKLVSTEIFRLEQPYNQDF